MALVFCGRVMRIVHDQFKEGITIACFECLPYLLLV